MGLLTSLAAAKYLFSGSGKGGGGGHAVYVPPSPEELAAMAQRKAEYAQRWADFKEHTPIGVFGSNCADFIAWVTFGSPGWIWFVLLGILIALFLIGIYFIKDDMDEATLETRWSFWIWTSLGTITLVLFALDSIVMLIRFVVWLFSPVF